MKQKASKIQCICTGCKRMVVLKEEVTPKEMNELIKAMGSMMCDPHRHTFLDLSKEMVVEMSDEERDKINRSLQVPDAGSLEANALHEKMEQKKEA